MAKSYQDFLKSKAPDSAASLMAQNNPLLFDESPNATPALMEVGTVDANLSGLSVPADPTSPAKPKEASPAETAPKSNAGRKKWADPAALPKGPKPSETTERVQVCVTPEEHSEIMTMKYRHKGMNGNGFLRWAVSDTMNHTYRCTSPECDGEFTARTTNTMDAPVPMCCPFCGQKNILPVKF